MSKNISWVVVDKISLVTKDEKPAVEKAETKFSIFKSFNFVQKKGADFEALDRIEKTLQKKVDVLENVEDHH